MGKYTIISETDNFKLSVLKSSSINQNCVDNFIQNILFPFFIENEYYFENYQTIIYKNLLKFIKPINSQSRIYKNLVKLRKPSNSQPRIYKNLEKS